MVPSSGGANALTASGNRSFADQSSQDDDAVGEADHRVDDQLMSFRADQQFLEAASVPGFGPFNDPASLGLQPLTSGDDPPSQPGSVSGMQVLELSYPTSKCTVVCGGQRIPNRESFSKVGRNSGNHAGSLVLRNSPAGGLCRR
jgi:hypothetical protein